MSLLVADCPRCGAQKITFNVTAAVHIHRDHGWKDFYEIFSICRQCTLPTIFLIALTTYERSQYFRASGALVEYADALNSHFEVIRYIGLREHVSEQPPEHLPENIAAAFNEGATCMSVACYNAAATMFRLCVDLATRPLLPKDDESDSNKPNARQRRDLGLRLSWLFENGQLPGDLKELAACIREDGNDGAHTGTLTQEDAEDLVDFTRALLERLFTQPARIELAKQRRDSRRAGG